MASKTQTTTKAKAGASPATASASPKATRTGVVETDKRAKTRKVVVSYMAKHPKYGKYVRQRTVLHVHDEDNVSKVGDVVEVVQCRPLSKTKCWKLLRIVEQRSEQAAALASAAQVM